MPCLDGTDPTTASVDVAQNRSRDGALGPSAHPSQRRTCQTLLYRLCAGRVPVCDPPRMEKNDVDVRPFDHRRLLTMTGRLRWHAEPGLAPHDRLGRRYPTAKVRELEHHPEHLIPPEQDRMPDPLSVHLSVHHLGPLLQYSPARTWRAASGWVKTMARVTH